MTECLDKGKSLISSKMKNSFIFKTKESFSKRKIIGNYFNLIIFLIKSIINCKENEQDGLKFSFGVELNEINKISNRIIKSHGFSNFIVNKEKKRVSTNGRCLHFI